MFTQQHLSPAMVALPLLMVIFLSACAPPSSESGSSATAATRPAAQLGLVVGTYTSEPEASDVGDSAMNASEGLYRVDFAAGTGFGVPELLAEIENPSFVAVDDGTGRLYVVSEVEDGQLLAYQWQSDTNSLALINQRSTGGAYPCYVALSPNKSKLAVANYGTGNIAVYGVDSTTGAMTGLAQQREHQGSGPNSERQEGPHAHWVQWSPEGDYLYAVDLGADQVKGYAVDPDSGELGEGFTAHQAEPGAGPRHMVFHPEEPLVYVLNELANTVTVARRQANGRFAVESQISTLPEGFSEHSQAAHIAVNSVGTRLYTSNRGHHSIAVFDIDGMGDLRLLQWVRSGGEWPRHFSLTSEEELLVVANEQSHNLVAFSVDDSGRLVPTGDIAQVAKPVFAAPFGSFRDNP